MQALLEFAPVVAFFVAYKLSGMYTATAVLMAGMALLLVVDFVRHRRIPAMHGLSAVLVFAFGTATLLLHDQRFIQWKPTVFFWLVAVAFLLSTWIGKEPLTQRLLSRAFDSAHNVPVKIWRRLNWLWVVFYAALGGLNLFVAYHASESTWVNFKLFGLSIATGIFIFVQILWLARRVEATQEPSTQA